MVLIYESIGTPALTSGDLMEHSSELLKHKQTDTRRKIISINLTGGSAINDTKLKLVKKSAKQGDKTLAYLYNSSTTPNLTRWRMIPVMEWVYPGEVLELTCIDAAPAECFIHFHIKTYPKRRRR